MTMFSMAGTTPDRTLSVIYANGDSATVPESHDRFEELVTLLLSGAEDEEVSELVDVMLAVSKRLSQLSERVSIRGRNIYFDGDPLRGELAEVLVELFEAGNPDALRPVLNFLEKASTNPSRKSVDDLYRWITKGDLIIHEDGDFLAYKAVRVDADGNRTSINSGTAFVDGEEINGNIPNPDGAVITMPRSDVDDDERTACSTGLHAGTYGYAEWFKNQQWSGNIVFVLVKINPRDVVSVPTDSSDQKLRVCRYVVQGEVAARQGFRVFRQPVEEPEVRVVADVEAAVLDAQGEDIPDNGILFIPEDIFDGEEDGDAEDEISFDEPTEEEIAHMYSGDALEHLRQQLIEKAAGTTREPTEAEVELAAEEEASSADQPATESGLRDSKGRFTSQGAVKAVRNAKGQFTKWS